MKMKSFPTLGLARNPMTFGRFGELSGHLIAIACAVGGLYLIIADSLDSALYGIGLIGLAIALDVIVASRCNDKIPRTRRVAHPGIVSIRTKKRRGVKP